MEKERRRSFESDRKEIYHHFGGSGWRVDNHDEETGTPKQTKRYAKALLPALHCVRERFCSKLRGQTRRPLTSLPTPKRPPTLHRHSWRLPHKLHFPPHLPASIVTTICIEYGMVERDGVSCAKLSWLMSGGVSKLSRLPCPVQMAAFLARFQWCGGSTSRS